jgi:hypothetical protein
VLDEPEINRASPSGIRELYEKYSLRMPGTIHSRHDRRNVPRNGPTSPKRSALLEKTPRAQARRQESRRENINRR